MAGTRITQLGLHGPQRAYAAFVAKTASAVIDIAYDITLYVMQTSATRLTVTQTANRDLYVAQVVDKTLRAT